MTTPLLQEQMQNSMTISDTKGMRSEDNNCNNNISKPSRMARIKSRLSLLRSTLTTAELSGSLGDLGTFIPLTTALARQRKISLAPSLFWAGICNIVSGLKWDVPMCVQPMKSIAAVALSGDVDTGGLDSLSVTTAGILTGVTVLFLGASNLMELVNAIVPETVVAGIQVGVGIRLASRGMNDIMDLSWVGGYDCIALAIGCAALSLFWLRESDKKECRGATNENMEQTNENSSDTNANSTSDDNVEMAQCNHSDLEIQESNLSETVASSGHLSPIEPSSPSNRNYRSPQNQIQTDSSDRHIIWNKVCCCLHLSPNTPHPVGIYLFFIGSVFAAVTLATATEDSGYDLPLHFFGAPLAINALKGVSTSDWRIGFFRGTLPQLPLTILNSVISVCCLAHQLYPEKRDLDLPGERNDAVISRREVSISVGLMNLLLCPLGSMPNCHGAGGLAGQHRFGARHGTSVIILGLFKVILAIFFGGSALTMLDAIPVAVLGVMVSIAGLELVGTGVSMLVGSVEKNEEKILNKKTSKTILREKTLVAMVTASVIIATARTDYGVLSGWVAHMIYGNGFLDFVIWLRTRKICKRER